MITGYEASDPIGGPQPFAFRNFQEDTGIFSSSVSTAFIRNPGAGAVSISDIARSNLDNFDQKYIDKIHSESGIDDLDIISDGLRVVDATFGTNFNLAVKEAANTTAEGIVDMFPVDGFKMPRNFFNKVALGKVNLRDPNIRKFLSPTHSRILEPEEANARFGIQGKLVFSTPVFENVAELKKELAITEILHADKLQRAKDTWTNLGVKTTGAILGALADPVNVLSAFIPIVGTAKWAAFTARIVPSLAKSQLFLRSSRGALEGLVGQALVEPLVFTAAREEMADYHLADSMNAIAMGTVFGGGLHVGFAGVGAGWRFVTRKGKYGDVDIDINTDGPVREIPRGELELVINGLNPLTRRHLMAAAVRNLETGQVIKGLDTLARTDPNFIDTRLKVKLDDAPAVKVIEDGKEFVAKFEKPPEGIEDFEVRGSDRIAAEQGLALEFIKRKLEKAEGVAGPARISEGAHTKFIDKLTRTRPEPTNKSGTKATAKGFYTLTKTTRKGETEWVAEVDTVLPNGERVQATLAAKTRKEAVQEAENKIGVESKNRQQEGTSRPVESEELIDQTVSDIRNAPSMTQATPDEVADFSKILKKVDPEIEDISKSIRLEVENTTQTNRRLDLNEDDVARLDKDNITQSVDSDEVVEYSRALNKRDQLEETVARQKETQAKVVEKEAVDTPEVKAKREKLQGEKASLTKELDELRVRLEEQGPKGDVAARQVEIESRIKELEDSIEARPDEIDVVGDDLELDALQNLKGELESIKAGVGSGTADIRRIGNAIKGVEANLKVVDDQLSEIPKTKAPELNKLKEEKSGLEEVVKKQNEGGFAVSLEGKGVPEARAKIVDLEEEVDELFANLEVAATEIKSIRDKLNLGKDGIALRKKVALIEEDLAVMAPELRNSSNPKFVALHRDLQSNKIDLHMLERELLPEGQIEKFDSFAVAEQQLLHRVRTVGDEIASLRKTISEPTLKGGEVVEFKEPPKVKRIKKLKELREENPGKAKRDPETGDHVFADGHRIKKTDQGWKIVDSEGRDIGFTGATLNKAKAEFLELRNKGIDDEIALLEKPRDTEQFRRLQEVNKRIGDLEKEPTVKAEAPEQLVTPEAKELDALNKRIEQLEAKGVNDLRNDFDKEIFDTEKLEKVLRDQSSCLRLG